jgi:peptidoglycan/xylan/chitin deacetylase (PgdA/CDA1 family)
MKRHLILKIALLCIALVVLSWCSWQLAKSRTFQLFGRLVANVPTGDRIVALTFDDGPTPETIDEILQILESRHVHATFFIIGNSLEKTPELGRRLVASGHELGNHTYSHEHLIFRSQSFIRSEIDRTDSLIRSAGELGEIYFRPPFGWKFIGLPWYLSQTGRTSITWDVAPDSPPNGSNSDRIVSACLKGVHPGSIIELHVWYPSRKPSRDALPIIIDRLRADGFEFVTIRELLASKYMSTKTL